MGIISFDKNCKYREINSKFCGMIGFDRFEILEQTFPDPFWPSPFYSKSMNDIDIFMQIGFLKIETFFQRKNNTFFPVQLDGCVIPNKKESTVEYVLLIEDISEKNEKGKRIQDVTRYASFFK